MALKFFDRVKETSATTGTGAMTLTGAVSTFRSFSSVYTVGDTMHYCITDQSGVNWEVGIGTYSSANTLTRTSVKASTNANAAVSFTGPTFVFVTISANWLMFPTLNSINNAQIKGFANLITNGTLNVWQEGTSFTPAGSTVTYCPENVWTYRNSTNYTVSQTTGSLAKYGMKVQRTAGDVSTNYIQFLGTVLETLESINYAGKSMTVSVWIKVGANYSGTNMTLQTFTGTGTDQSAAGYAAGSWTGGAYQNTTISGMTTSLQRFQATVSIPAGTTQIGVGALYTPSGTAGADDSVTIEQWQFEEGLEATNFEHPPIQLEIANCQRMFEKSFNMTVAPIASVGVPGGEYYGICGKAGALQNNINIPFKVTKRIAPAMVYYTPGAAGAQIRNTNTATSGTGTTSQNANQSGACATCTGAAGWAVGDLIAVHWTANARF